jgi:uncharacterized protein
MNDESPGDIQPAQVAVDPEAAPQRVRGDHKVVITGSAGVGKSTLISTVSDFGPLRTEAIDHHPQSGRRSMRSVTIDYGELSFPDGDRLRLYGTPDGSRSPFVRDVLARGAAGLIVLVSQAQADGRASLRRSLDEFAELCRDGALLVAVTQGDLAPGSPIGSSLASTAETCRVLLAQAGLSGRVLTIDPRQRDQALDLFSLLRDAIDARPVPLPRSG